jgi:hypothetical protein
MSQIVYATYPSTEPLPQFPRVQFQRKSTAAEKKSRALTNTERQQRIQEDVENWYKETLKLADRMSEEYGHGQRHYLDMLFYRGTTRKNKVNTWNAFLSQKAIEVNAGMPYLLVYQHIFSPFVQALVSVNRSSSQSFRQTLAKNTGHSVRRTWMRL